jgi:hypothetical protein
MLNKLIYILPGLTIVTIANLMTIAPSEASSYDCNCAGYRACKVRQRALMAVPVEPMAATPTETPPPPAVETPPTPVEPQPQPTYKPSTKYRNYKIPRGRG